MSNNDSSQANEDLRNEGGAEEASADAVPPAIMPEEKPRRTHERSHAAHLEDDRTQPQTKPAIDMRESKLPGKRKQP